MWEEEKGIRLEQYVCTLSNAVHFCFGIAEACRSNFYPTNFPDFLIELPGTTSNMCQAKVYQWFDICPTKKSNQHHFWRNTHQSFARKLQPRTTTNVCCLYNFHTRMIRMCNGFKPCIATAGAHRTFVNNRFAIKCEFHRFLLSYFTFKWQWYDISKSFLNSNHFYWIEKETHCYCSYPFLNRIGRNW